MDESVKGFLMSQGLYQRTLGGYQSFDNSNNPYDVFYGVRQKIGTGGFGVVYHADRYLAKPDGIRKDPNWPECAIKELKAPSETDARLEEVKDRIRRELEFNKNGRLHNKKHLVVPIRVHLVKNEPPLIVMEYCCGGDLARYWLKCNQRLSEKLSKKMVTQVVLGLKELREEGFFHRDVKPANVFIAGSTDDESRMNFKLGDFGLVAEIGEEHRILCGTPANLAPEINGRGSYGPEVDVWSLGVLLYTMLIGQVPFRGANDCDTIRKSREEVHHFPDHANITYEAKDLINRMLQKDPRRRIPLEDILCHPFLKENPTKTSGVQQSSLFSNDSGFSSSNTSGSVGSSPALRNMHFRPGKLPSVLETEPERFRDQMVLGRKDFVRNLAPSSNPGGPVVASLRLESELFQRSQSYNQSFENQININARRYASSAPSLASNLSTASMGVPPVLESGSATSRSSTVTLSKPLSTSRLRPSTKKHNFKIGCGLIQEDGCVRLEFNIPKKTVHNYISKSSDTVLETMLISPDGLEIQVSRTNVPEFGIRRWNYDELPTKYWSKYNYAAKFVLLVRESTPKITVYTDEAVYRLMENGPPEGNFEVQFYSGAKFTFSASKSRWTSNLPDVSEPHLHPDFQSLEVERERVRHLEKMMEDLEREEDKRLLPGKRYMKFPLVMGKRPTSMSSLPKVSKQSYSRPGSPNYRPPSPAPKFQI